MTDQTSPHPIVGGLTAEDNDVVFKGPAVATNRMVVHVLGNALRLTFLEMYAADRPSAFRTAVMLQAADAQALIALLQQYVPLISPPSPKL